MSNLKTATSALTAALLVTGIGLAVAQTDDQQQPADPMTAATAATPTMPTTISEQTPADPNAVPPADNTAQIQQQTPQVDPAAPLPSTTPGQSATDNSYPTPATTTTPAPSPSPAPSYEPAPRADRN